VTERVMVVIACCTSPSDLLNHHQPVGGLHSSPFQTIIKNRILIGIRSKLAAWFITRMLTCRVYLSPAANPSSRSSGGEYCLVPPERILRPLTTRIARHRLVSRDGVHDAINNQLRNPQKPDWKER